MASAVLAIKILADAAQAKAGLADAEKSTSKWSGGLSKAAAGATVALAGVTAVVIGGVKAAADDAQQQAVLANALKKSAGASDAAVASTEDWITKTAQATGVADDQLRPALGNLVRATGDVGKAQEGMALALDISAATGKDVDAVSKALAKGYAGQTTAIGRLVPGMDAAVLASGDMAAVSDELASKVGGSAAAAADTAAGQYKIFANNLAETKEGIGAALLPVVTSLAGQMAGLAKVAQDNSGALTILLGVVGALAAIVITVNAVTKVWAAMQAIASAATTVWSIAQKVLNATLKDNPIGIVITVVALLVGAIILAYKHSETFRNIVDGAFRAVKTAAQFAWDWISGHWPLLLAIITGPIGLAVLAVAKHWDAITAGAQAVIGWFRSGWDVLKGIITAPIDAAWAVISGIFAKIRAGVSAITSAVKSIPIPKVPDLNPFSVTPGGGGAVATGATATLRGVGHAPAARGGTSTGRGATNINVNGALDPEAVARQIRAILSGHDVRVGMAPIRAGMIAGRAL